MSEKVIYIIAGSGKQFEYYRKQIFLAFLKANKNEQPEIRYLKNRFELDGVKDFKVTRVGTWYRSCDTRWLADYALARRGHPMIDSRRYVNELSKKDFR